MQSNHGKHDYPYTRLVDDSGASGQGRKQSEENSQMRNQADKAAYHPKKIKIRNAQTPENDRTHHSAYQPDQGITDDKAANHRRYSAYCAVGHQAMLLGKESHGGSMRMILPCKHEVH